MLPLALHWIGELLFLNAFKEDEVVDQNNFNKDNVSGNKRQSGSTNDFNKPSTGSNSSNLGSNVGSNLGANQNAQGGSSINASNIDDVIRESLTNVMNRVVSNLEPQLNDMATKIANQAVDKGRDFASTAYRRVQTQPWYLVGFAAVLLVGAAIVIGFSAESSDTSSATPDLH